MFLIRRRRYLGVAGVATVIIGLTNQAQPLLLTINSHELPDPPTIAPNLSFDVVFRVVSGMMADFERENLR